MKLRLCNTFSVVAFACCGLVLQSGYAQQTSTAPAVETALLQPAGPVPASSSTGASTDPASPGATSPATAAAATATATGEPGAGAAGSIDLTDPATRKAVIKEMMEMKARIAQMAAALEATNEATEEKSAAHDADVLRGAATGGSSDTSLPVLQAATPGPAAAAPPPPEISAETTTKSAPFPGDWTWLNSGGHNVDSPMSTKYFTPEIRFDTNYILDYNHPQDDTMGGSTEMFRSQEVQLEQVSVGGDFRIQNVRGRLLTMNGMFATTTIRNDGSYSRGQWQLNNAYRYFSEAWGGYHWDVSHGLNVDGGIFVSYIGLFSYYNFDNWAYQPSFVSSNTPWFFNGLRIQWWPTEKLKIEPWIINGWQSYARYNGKPGLGGQILYRPKPWLDVVWNDYGLGEDDAGYPGRSRIHADYSVQVKAYDKPTQTLDKIAFTVTGDLGCEYGGGPASFAMTGGTLNQKGLSPEQGNGVSTYNGGVNCHNSANGRPKQEFSGWMSYLRFWFKKDIYAVTLGGGEMNNPGRYLTLLPPINGATATTGSPYFTENANDRAQMHDGTITLDYMPAQFITFRLEESYRYSDVPYWTGRGGITPYAPGLGNIHQNVGNPANYICSGSSPAGLSDSGVGYVSASGGPGLQAAVGACGGTVSFTPSGGLSSTSLSNIWWPDLRTNQTATILAVMVRF
jgi:hypothetical protein